MASKKGPAAEQPDEGPNTAPEADTAQEAVDHRLWDRTLWEPSVPDTVAPSGYKWWGDVDPLPVHWAWHGMVPLGALTIVMGAPGTTKSSLMAEVAARFSCGDLPGDCEGEKGTVLWLSREDSTHISIAPKLVAAKAGERVLLVDEEAPSAMGINLTSEMGIRALETMIDSHGVQMVIVDPLMAFTASKFSMQTNTAAVIQAVTPLAQLCATRNIAIIGVMHTAKGKVKASIDSISGSQGFASTGRHVLLVGKYKKGHLVSPVKSNIGRTGHGRLYNVSYVEVSDSVDPLTQKSKTIVASKVAIGRPSVPSEMEDCLKQESVDGFDPRIREMLTVLNEDALTAMDTNVLYGRMLQDNSFTAGRRQFRNLVAEVRELGYIRQEDHGFGEDKRRFVWITVAGRSFLSEDVDKLVGPKRPPRRVTTFFDTDAPEVPEGEDDDA